MTQDIVMLVILAIVTEALTENTMLLLPAAWRNVGGVQVARWVALAWAVVVSWSTGADLLAAVGLPAVQPVVAVAVTAFVLQRGANGLHDLLSKIAAE